MAYQAGKEERKWLSYTSISRTFSFWLMSTLNMAPDFREACEGWHFHTQQHLVTTHDVPSTWLLTSLSVCVRMLNALWQIWRGAYSVTKQSKQFLRKCPTIMRYTYTCPYFHWSVQKGSLSLSLSLALSRSLSPCSHTQSPSWESAYTVCHLHFLWVQSMPKLNSVVIL